MGGATDGHRIRLWLRRDDLLLHWPRCGGVADFLAHYLMLPELDAICCSTVFNEVVENAAKYASPGDTPIEVHAHGDDYTAVIETRHLAEPEQIARLEHWLSRAAHEEPDMVLRRTAHAAHADSGVGLLTVLRDYRARLSVVLEDGAVGRREVRVRVEIPLQADAAAQMAPA